jgi:hypothetical protein
MPLRLRLPRPGDEMKTLVVVLIAATLLVCPACAKTDWIDRTLVTVDVTGNWAGVLEGVGRDVSFELEQQGSTVKGYIRVGAAETFIAGPISGTVAGDVFRFKNTRGDMEGELTVSGDEMTGRWSRVPAQAGQGGARQMSLRRVTPSSPPASPPR